MANDQFSQAVSWKETIMSFEDIPAAANVKHIVQYFLFDFYTSPDWKKGISMRTKRSVRGSARSDNEGHSWNFPIQFQESLKSVRFWNAEFFQGEMDSVTKFVFKAGWLAFQQGNVTNGIISYWWGGDS